MVPTPGGIGHGSGVVSRVLAGSVHSPNCGYCSFAIDLPIGASAPATDASPQNSPLLLHWRGGEAGGRVALDEVHRDRSWRSAGDQGPAVDQTCSGLARPERTRDSTIGAAMA